MLGNSFDEAALLEIISLWAWVFCVWILKYVTCLTEQDSSVVILHRKVDYEDVDLDKRVWVREPEDPGIRALQRTVQGAVTRLSEDLYSGEAGYIGKKYPPNPLLGWISIRNFFWWYSFEDHDLELILVCHSSTLDIIDCLCAMAGTLVAGIDAKCGWLSISWRLAVDSFRAYMTWDHEVPKRWEANLALDLWKQAGDCWVHRVRSLNAVGFE